jgi:hypothetical protein
MENKTIEVKMVAAEQASDRKPYSTPTLRPFGDVQAIVMGPGGKGADGSTGS